MTDADDACLDLPVVSYRGLQRSARIMQIMLRYYFPLHDFDIDDYFACYPLLSFFSAYIYQTDERVEAAQAAKPEEVLRAGREGHALVSSVLRALHLHDPEVEREFGRLEIYLELETRLLHASEFDHSELRRAMELRSCDLRAMHRLTLLALRQSIDESLFELCYPLEVMAEIRDDLYQCEADRASGQFNSYLQLEKLYGAAAPERLLQERAYYQGMFQQRMRTASAELQELMASRGEEAFALDTLPCPDRSSN